MATRRLAELVRGTADRVGRGLFGRETSPSRVVRVLALGGLAGAAAVARGHRRPSLSKRSRRRLARPSDGFVPRWLFLRLLGITYSAAFLSALVQVRGLVGEGGITPAREYLQLVRRAVEHPRRAAPSFLWLDASDRGLRRLCLAGTLLPVLLFLDVAPVAVLAVLWALYLSLTTGGQQFLRYQWDALLLESGLLATLYAPRGLRPTLARQAPPSRLAVWLMRWLHLRVVLSSGVAKLASHDTTWREATALRHHYETQPLPTWTSFYAHHLPGWFHRLSVYGVWLSELVMPPLTLGPRRARALAATSTLGLQGLIAATGNYGFFNFLTAALTVPLLDDAQLAGKGPLPHAPRTTVDSPRRWTRARTPLGFALFVLGAIPLADVLELRVPWPGWLQRAYGRLAPLQVANPYGLFAVMTTRRPELVVEGSDDGLHWRAYELEWKPGDPMRRPRFAPLHLPRLDWQMWFAALHPSSQMRWLEPFLLRLLTGAPGVLALLHGNPFPDRPPTWIRVRVFDYRFASLAEHRRTGAWWTREPRYELVPAVRLEPSRSPGEAARLST